MSELRDEIYQILYDKSRVDGIRLINEDEWPIDELEHLVRQREDDLLHRITPLKYASTNTVREFIEALEDEICTEAKRI